MALNSKDEKVLIGNLSDGVRYPVTLKHMDKPTERAPLLTLEQETDDHPFIACTEEAKNVRDFYEALISSGELRVVKTATLNEDGECSICGSYEEMPSDVNGDSMVAPFCSGCGNPITKP